MRERQTRTVTQALVVFLLKLRTENSNKMIASIPQLEQEQFVSEHTPSIIKSFKNDILPSYFEFRGTSRRDLIDSHSAEFAKSCIIQLTGYVIKILGPYTAQQNDATIMYICKLLGIVYVKFCTCFVKLSI